MMDDLVQYKSNSMINDVLASSSVPGATYVRWFNRAMDCSYSKVPGRADERLQLSRG